MNDASPSPRALERLKRQSTAQLLFKCARLVDERALAKIREATGHPIRRAHTALFPHLDLDGTRITVLAARLGVSKQAVAPLVDELCQWGMLEKISDPSDGRARLVRFVGGTAGIAAGLTVLASVETELAEQVGADHWSALHHALFALAQVLDQ